MKHIAAAAAVALSALVPLHPSGATPLTTESADGRHEHEHEHGGGTTIDLTRAVALAQDNDPDLQYLRSLHAADRYRVADRYRAAFPRLSLSYAHSDTVAYASPDNRSRRASIGVEQLLYDGGRTRRAIRIARTDRDLRGLAAEKREREIAHTVTRSYLQVLALRQRVEISESTLEISRAHLEIGRTRHALEQTTSLSLRELELNLQSQELDLLELQLEHVAASRRFARLIDPLNEQRYPEGRLNIEYSGLPYEMLRSIRPADGVSRSRAYAEQRAYLRQAVQREQVARRGFLPRVSLEGELSATGNEFPLDRPGFSIGVRVQLAPVLGSASVAGSVGSPYPDARTRTVESSMVPLERLTNLYSVADARSERLRAEASYTRHRDTEISDLSLAIEDIGRRREHIALLRRRIATQRERIAISELRAELGELTRLDLLEQIEQLNALESRLADGVVDLHERELSLLERTGFEYEPALSSKIITGGGR